MIKKIILLSILVACAPKQDFKEGICVMTPDGLVTKIIKIENDQYITQKKVNNAWAEENKTPFSSLQRSQGFIETNCH